MSKEFDKLKTVVNRTKKALIDSWKENNESFIDKNYFLESGVYSECVGLTGTSMFIVAFSQEPEIISEEDKNVITDITQKTVRKINDWVKESGYTARPLIREQGQEQLFNKEYGYIDTITWVLSSMVLLRYSRRKNLITLGEETDKQVNELLSDAFLKLCNAQHDDGTWGFRTDKESSKALYYTYTAAVSLADFFDYIMGELSEYEKKDTEILGMLAKKAGKTPKDIENLANKTREKIQSWLINNCLPYLPKLAECKRVTEEERSRLGTWDTNVTEELGLRDNYYQLYYCYYLLEMMVTSTTDIYFSKLIKDEPDLNKLKTSYTNNRLMDLTDREFHFSNSDTRSNMWLNIMEQSIYTTRSKYMIAKRTGDSFWSDTSSELKLSWLHDDNEVKAVATRFIRQSNNITDPTLAPLALRANINYSYYISKQRDIVIERLFDEICENAAEKTNNSLTTGLWDTTSYSLLITEKSIEALVDYYDYIVQFIPSYKESETSSDTAETETEIIKSELDLLLEKKIEEFMRSKAGKEAILSATCETSLQGTNAGANNMDAFNAKAVFEYMKRILEIAGNTEPDWNSSDEKAQIASVLQKLYFEGMRLDIYSRADKEKVKSRDIKTQLTKLFTLLAKDFERPGFSLIDLYIGLKASSDQ